MHGHCTRFSPKYQDLVGKVEARGSAPNGPVHDVDGKYTDSDVKEFGGFVPVPCRRGGVRISRPEILHGSTPSMVSRRRRTILPWFIGVSPDGTSVDNPESDQVDAVARAHASQCALSSTPSGLANRFGVIPYRFPASTQLFLDSHISNALLCRTSWDDPLVQAEANLLFGADRGTAARLISAHRLNALQAFKKKWFAVESAERACYGKKSFFVQNR